MWGKLQKIPARGISLIEVVVVLVIVAILAGLVVATLAGSKRGDYIDRATQMIYNDLILIRSRSLSTNLHHRLNFSTVSSWKVQSYDEGGSNWVDVGDVRIMPTDTYLTNSAFLNAGSNLEATPRGMFDFKNSAIGSPYVTVTGLGATKLKSIEVFPGGAVDIRIE